MVRGVIKINNHIYNHQKNLKNKVCIWNFKNSNNYFHSLPKITLSELNNHVYVFSIITRIVHVALSLMFNVDHSAKFSNKFYKGLIISII